MHNPAVALFGPRQVGKTTLALLIAGQRPSVYVDLESPEDLLKLRDPYAFLSAHNDKLVILDEIQRVPDLFKLLRGLIDKNRQAGKKGEQFLLLGSASMDLLRQSSESLAGRIHYIGMGGLNILEVPHGRASDIFKLWFRVPAVRLRRLWTMLAHLQGETLNYSKLGANLEVDGKTVHHYLEILVDLLLVRRLEPWYANVKKRLVKSPRFYIRDTGLLHRLLSIPGHDALFSNPVLGKSWEGFVIENLLSILPDSVQSFFTVVPAAVKLTSYLNFLASTFGLWK